MSDNVATVTPPSSLPVATIIATEQLADGSQVQKIKIIDGTEEGTTAMIVTAGGAAKVDGSGVTQPVSVASVPLPTGAAQDGADMTTPVPAMPAGGVGIRGWLSAIWTKLNATLAVTGVFWQATQPVSLASVPSHAVTNAGTFAVQDSPATIGAATLSNVASSATTVTLLASNAARKMATFFNDSTAILYLKFGATASAASYTVQLAPGGYYELPRPVYTGVIDGIWAAANGFCHVTEL
jgi:hypothetical protein